MPRQTKRPVPLWRRLLPWAGVIAAVILLAVALWPAADQSPAEISVSEAHALYGRPDVFFLDVRQPEEWEAFHAPRSTLIPLDQLSSRLDEVPRDRKIVVVCRSGNRSQQGRDILLAAGFKDVVSMAGGLTQWRALGYETVSGP